MVELIVERIGGLAGFGVTGSHLVSGGRVLLSDLSQHEQQILESLFAKSTQKKPRDTLMRDGFRYKISRSIDGKHETIELSESDTPETIIKCVHDELI